MNFIALLGLVSAAAAVTVGVQPVPPKGAALVPMFRFWDGSRHFYTLNRDEPDPRSFTEEGRPILVQRTPPDSRFAPIYRCYAPDEDVHFVSLDPGCEGVTTEASYGYISATPRPGYHPLYALYNPSINDQVVTANYGEGPAHGYRLQQVLGFVPD